MTVKEQFGELSKEIEALRKRAAAMMILPEFPQDYRTVGGMISYHLRNAEMDAKAIAEVGPDVEAPSGTDSGSKGQQK